MISPKVLSDAKIGSRIVVWIGPSSESGLEIEKLVVVESVNELDSKLIYPYRADLIIINDADSDFSSHFLLELDSMVHDDGAIWVAHSNPSPFREVLTSIGFRSLEFPGLFKRTPLSSPPIYDDSYLARWGSTNFMSNWKSASEEILAHAPSENREELRILDIGSFNGYIMESLRLAGVREIFGVEISYDLAVKNSVNRYHLPATRVTDFLKSGLPSGYFNMTLAMEILEHIPPDLTGAFISEIRRVTRDDGVVLISASDDWDADPTHVNCRSRSDWYFQFAKSGFTPFGSQTIFPGFNSFVFKKNTKSFSSHLCRVRYGIQASGLLNFIFKRERPVLKPVKNL